MRYAFPIVLTLAAAAVTEVSLAQTTSPAERPEQAVGHTIRVTMNGAPEPYSGPSVRNSPVIIPRAGRMPDLPPGFSATLFAEGLPKPRQLLALPNGDVVVSIQEGGYLMMMRDGDGDGRADWIERHAAQFNNPYGLGHREGELLVADQDGIWRLDYTRGSLRPPFAQAKPLSEATPEERVPQPRMDGQQLLTGRGVFGIVQGHYNRDLAVGRDGVLYVGVGSAGNIGVEPSPKSTIQVFSASGGNQRTVASGMRNPSGIAVHPETGELWAVVQERDGLGDVIVPDFLTRVRNGAFYGFPYSYIGSNPQPGFAQLAPERVRAAVVPDLLLEAHGAAMDLDFYDGTAFPAEYRGDAFVAMKGSWNRSTPTGYKVVRVRMRNGRPTGEYQNFMTGFWVAGDDKAQVWGRPVDVEVAPDGALFVVDESGGTIWRVTYNRSEAAR